MSSKGTCDANVLLAGIQFRNLGEPMPVSDWFKAWKRAVVRNELLTLLSLIHWGLQLLPYLKKYEAIHLVAHYLAVADGHQSPENFGNYKDKHQTMLGTLSDREVRLRISDAAWMELCNRVFVQETDEYGKTLKYARYFSEPALAAAMIKFIDPDRWCDGTCFNYFNANLNRLNKSAYQKKAHKFVRAFLRFAWHFPEKREGMDYSSYFYDAKPSREEAYSRAKDYFRRLRPKLVALMHDYQMLGYLHDCELDGPSRRALRDIALGKNKLRPSNPEFEDAELSQFYGQLDPEHEWRVCTNPEAARILLLYPLILRGRREYNHQQARKRAAEKTEKAAELKKQLEETTTQLQTQLQLLS
jgi:hypothetical protein